MTETTIISSVSESVSETETEVTSIIEDLLANASMSTQEEKDRLGQIFSSLGTTIKNSIPSLLFALFIFAAGIAISKGLLKIFTRFMEKTNTDHTAISFLRSLVKILLYTIVFIITLSILNIPMTSIIAVISAAGLAVGLALQNSLSNLAGGFIILFSKPFKSGDYVETNSVSGVVESISILYTKILTNDNKTIYIPNGKVSDSQIINYSEQPVRRVDLEFGISYSDDVEKAKSVIMDLAKSYDLVLKEPEPFVRLGVQAEDSLQIVVRLWTETENYWQVKFDFTEMVNKAFSENGITIPFRQLDVHITSN
ncbi:MAG: mechanosensitive ion channel [Oscillospiraceae bacterium]|nr:mechanosensitive ion channel [Oscillospiraceae bacterium]